MKKFKYLKLFEAFESIKLSKTLNFIKDKSNFLEKLKKIANRIDFPYSKYSDDFFQYLPFRKALNLNYSIIDEPCEATSISEFPGYGIEGEKCQNGQIKRTWGRGTRYAVCPVCRGSGIKPKTTFEIKWIKFWFSKDGDYIETTVTDGKIREQYSKIANYDVIKKILRPSDWDSVQTGDNVRINIEGERIIGTFYREGNNYYIIQNYISGAIPYKNDWKKYGKYSWNITGGNSYSEIPEILIIDDDNKINPFDWNAIYNVDRNTIISRNDVEDRLSNAHFAIVLDFLELKKSEYIKTSQIKAERGESVKGALALSSNEIIRKQNLNRYIEEMAKKIDISENLIDFKKTVLKYLGGNKIGYHILRGRNFSDFNYFIDKIVKFINSSDEEKNWYYKEALSDVRYKNRQNNEFNIRVTDDISNTYKILDNDRKIILEKLEELNSAIFSKIKSANIENLEDIEILWEKINSIRNVWRSSNRFINLRKLYYSVEYMADSNRLERNIKDIDKSSINLIINDIDRFIIFINKL
jgi:hypothetical protein